jgi:dihydropyrimidinase
MTPAGPAGVVAVTGGTVVTPSGTRRADVLIEGGKIAAVAAPGTGGADGSPAEGAGSRGTAGSRRLEASGCFVLPGGVDPHCHIMADVAAATRAAALGGTTSALSFTNPDPGEAAIA